MQSFRALTVTLGLILGVVVASAPSSRAWAADITVFAAASTTNALTEAATAFTDQGGGKVVLSFASSAALAKQIENGAPADLFLSANAKWMNYLAEKKVVAAESVFDLLGNSLVMVAPAPGAVPVAIGSDMKLAELLGDGRLALGDPDHIPAGIYAKQALTALGQWGSVESKLARTNDVRAALALVERGEVPFGIVYSTDAAISDKVAIVGTFPAFSHQPITYPVGIVAGRGSDAARAFLAFLKTDAAKAIFAKHGFDVK